MIEKKSDVANNAKIGSAKGFNLKNRKPAYVAGAIILIGLLVMYLLNVYHNQHESRSPLPPKTMTKPEQ